MTSQDRREYQLLAAQFRRGDHVSARGLERLASLAEQNGNALLATRARHAASKQAADR